MSSREQSPDVCSSPTAAPNSDRTVHGLTRDGREIVRYDRAGKWWIEFGERRYRVTIDHAVTEALMPAAQVFLGKPGGMMFDAKVRRRRGF